MHTGWIERAAVGLLVLATGSAGAQDKGPAKPATSAKPSQLEEMLAQVLRTNPDVRVAEAKLAEAEAQLTRARLQAMEQAVTHYQQLATLRDQQRALLEEMKVIERMAKKGYRSMEELRVAEAKLVQLKATLAAAEAQTAFLMGKEGKAEAKDRSDVSAQVAAALQYLMARQAQSTQDASSLAMRALKDYYSQLAAGDRARLQGPVSEKLRQALDKPVDLGAKEVSLDALPGLLQKHLPEGVYVKVVPGKAFPDKVTLEVKSLPLGAALQWLEDSLPGARVVVRGYGLLITEEGRVPPGAPALNEFWKGPVTEEATRVPSSRSQRNSPTGKILCSVEAVDEKAGLVEISLGAEAGLKEGHTLEVFRLNPSKYLGTIRIIKVTANKAVGQPVQALADKVQPGDIVSSQVARN